MIPGPTLIKKCSDCAQFIEQDTIISGNTMGAKVWTDGWQDAPMMPDQPQLVACPHCKALLWLHDLEQAGEIEPWGEKKKFSGSRPYDVPGFNTYMEFLEKGVSDPGKERYLRLRAWWAGNDTRRETEHKAPLSEAERTNLTAAAGLLDEVDQEDRLMKAEIMRELGRFDEAKKLLDKPFDHEYVQAQEIIRDLVVQKNPFVTEMRFD